MFDFLFFEETKVDDKISGSPVPIHIKAENMLIRAFNTTINQFNDACETVCNENPTRK